jgi:hypothetical protein
MVYGHILVGLRDSLSSWSGMLTAARLLDCIRIMYLRMVDREYLAFFRTQSAAGNWRCGKWTGWARWTGQKMS